MLTETVETPAEAAELDSEEAAPARRRGKSWYCMPCASSQHTEWRDDGVMVCKECGEPVEDMPGSPGSEERGNERRRAAAEMAVGAAMFIEE